MSNDIENALHHINVAKLRDAIEKKASFWKNFTNALRSSNMGKQVGEAVLAAGAAAGVTAAGAGVAHGYKALRGRVEKPKAFKSMMGAMPGLKKEDPKAVQMTFNTLYGMNRQMAKDPLVAGSFVSRNVRRAEMGGEAGAYVDPQTAKTLMDAGSKRDSGPVESAWQRGAQQFDLGKGGDDAVSAKTRKFVGQYGRTRKRGRR
jgi:hypothetical protein